MRPQPGRMPLPTEARRAADSGPAIRRYRTMLFRSYLAGAIIGFGALVLVARRRPHFDLDLRIARAMQRPDYPAYARFMHAISWPGYPPQANLLAALLAVGLYRGG